MNTMATERASNGIANGHNGQNGHNGHNGVNSQNGFHSDSEPDSISTDASDLSLESTDSLNGTTTNGTSSSKVNPRRRKRKQSSPMMPAFMVSAPGKVIVFGEHSVVHGKVSTDRGWWRVENLCVLICWFHRPQ